MPPNDNQPFKAERTLLGVAMEPNQKEEVVPERLPGYTDGNVTATTPDVSLQEMRVVGGNREMYDQIEGQYDFSGGSWTLNPWDGWPIAFVLGNENIMEDTPEVGLTTHELTAKQTGMPPTATAEYVFIGADGQDDMVMPYLGVFATQGSLSQDNEGLLEFSVDNEALGVPSDVRDTGARTDGVTTGSWLPDDRDPWKFDGAKSNLSLFGTSFARMTDFTLDINNGSESQWYTQDDAAHEPYEATYGNVEYSLDVEINISDPSLYNELVTASDTGFEANIEFAKQFTPDETLLIECMGAKFENAPHDIPESGAVGVSASMVPESVKITVVDTYTNGEPYLGDGTPA